MIKYPKRSMDIKEKKTTTSAQHSKQRRLLKIFLGTSSIGLTVAMSLLFFFEQNHLAQDFSSHSSPVPTLVSLMKYDFNKLHEQKSIPDTLLNIRQLHYHDRTENLKIESKDLSQFMNLKTSGKFILTIEFYPFPEEEKSYLVQFNWIDIKSKDKVWEMNRVYRLQRKK